MLFAISGPKTVGKSTFAAQLMGEAKHRGLAIYRFPFAQTIKDLLDVLLRELGFNAVDRIALASTAKEDIIPGLGVTWRYMAQTLGTDWGRNTINADIWLKVWQAKYQAVMRQHTHAGVVVVVDDMRFDSERRLVRQLGGTAILLQSAEGVDLAVDQHESEVGLAPELFDVLITNERKSIQPLQHAARHVLDVQQAKPRLQLLDDGERRQLVLPFVTW